MSKLVIFRWAEVAHQASSVSKSGPERLGDDSEREYVLRICVGNFF